MLKGPSEPPPDRATEFILFNDLLIEAKPPEKKDGKYELLRQIAMSADVMVSEGELAGLAELAEACVMTVCDDGGQAWAQWPARWQPTSATRVVCR